MTRYRESHRSLLQVPAGPGVEVGATSWPTARRLLFSHSNQRSRSAMSSQFKGPGLISGLGNKGDDAPPLATAAASATTGGGGGGEGGGMKTSGAGAIGTSVEDALGPRWMGEEIVCARPPRTLEGPCMIELVSCSFS